MALEDNTLISFKANHLDQRQQNDHVGVYVCGGDVCCSLLERNKLKFTLLQQFIKPLWVDIRHKAHS